MSLSCQKGMLSCAESDGLVTWSINVVDEDVEPGFSRGATHLLHDGFVVAAPVMQTQHPWQGNPGSCCRISCNCPPVSVAEHWVQAMS